jgi:hypothetical protein
MHVLGIDRELIATSDIDNAVNSFDEHEDSKENVFPRSGGSR